MMNKLPLPLRASALFAVTLLFVVAVQAQVNLPTRTWVSGIGDDSQPCSRTAPCKTFVGALTKTATGGEITAMDSGGFGSVRITKSITLDGTGVPSSIMAAQTTGITIDIAISRGIGRDPKADTARAVRIRGLAINGLGSGINGITVLRANSVSVEDCVIDGFTGNGINIRAGTLFVRNSSIRNNTGMGINVESPAKSGITNTSLVFNGQGLAGAVTQYCCVVLYGNRTGDPPPPGP